MKKGMKKFVLLWIGELISVIGSGLTSFGLGVYVYNLTGSATQMSLISLLGFLPSILLSVPAGALADRMDRRLLLILGDGLSGLGIIFILVSMLLDKCDLWNIYVGITISSIFSSLVRPAFNATITDLVGKEDLTKASGLMSIAGSAQFLVSPVVAGFLLSVSDIKLLLIIDICTFIVTVLVTFIIKKGMVKIEIEKKESFLSSIKEGLKYMLKKKGILVLAIVGSMINLFMGFIQVLSESYVLGFTDTKLLGICEAICASGMLVASIVVGVIGIKRHQSKVLSIALIISSIGMIGFGLLNNIYVMCLFGFIFFFALPFANTSLDYLVRINVDEQSQGRVWGLIGLISQIGSLISFATCGIIADQISLNMNISVSEASGYAITIGGIFMGLIAIGVLFVKSIKKLEVQEEK